MKERRSRPNKRLRRNCGERGRDYHAMMVSGQHVWTTFGFGKKGIKGETWFREGNKRGLERRSFLISPLWLKKEGGVLKDFEHVSVEF